tara:strand:- start:33156 stop:33839 length:684 start_codon:yes stop_codon:yes gene_type:complete
LQENQKKLQQKNSDFYTSSGLHVFFKEPVINDEVDVEKVIATVESRIPRHLYSEIEMIIVGWFEEFEERSINAFYDSGTIYLSNVQDNNADMVDDIVHEIAHALEAAHGYFIYADNKIRDEFLSKRRLLHDLLWSKGIKAPLSFFMNPEYDQEFDMFLYEKVGYDKLSIMLQGVFITPYAATSLQEYFATGFEEFHMNSEHNFFKKVSPSLYEKVYKLQNADELDMY